jgi:hypothetical protein
MTSGEASRARFGARDESTSSGTHLSRGAPQLKVEVVLDRAVR